MTLNSLVPQYSLTFHYPVVCMHNDVIKLYRCLLETGVNKINASAHGYFLT